MEEEDSGFPRREGSPSLPLFEVGSYSNFLETGKCRPNTTAIAQNTNGNLKKERAGLKKKKKKRKGRTERRQYRCALVCACLHQNLPNQKLNPGLKPKPRSTQEIPGVQVEGGKGQGGEDIGDMGWT